jgi:hypothetical protein
VLVPELVDVAEVSGSDLRDGLAGAVARAHAVGVGGAAGTLTGRTVVAFKAGAGAGLAVANTLVGALAVLVGRVGDDIAVKILGSRVLLGGSEWVNSVIHNNGVIGARKLARGSIQISLGGIHVSKTELAYS